MSEKGPGCVKTRLPISGAHFSIVNYLPAARMIQGHALQSNGIAFLRCGREFSHSLGQLKPFKADAFRSVFPPKADILTS